MAIDIMIEMIIGIGLIATTSVLFAIVLLTYLRMRNTRMALITLGFGTFFMGAIIHLPQIFSHEYNLMITENVLLLIQLIGLLFIAVGVLKD
jgi:ABC-type branched-subunit amino acid transport system permease subunit